MGALGLEPRTSALSERRSSQLSYAPRRPRGGEVYRSSPKGQAERPPSEGTSTAPSTGPRRTTIDPAVAHGPSARGRTVMREQGAAKESTATGCGGAAHEGAAGPNRSTGTPSHRRRPDGPGRRHSGRPAVEAGPGHRRLERSPPPGAPRPGTPPPETTRARSSRGRPGSRMKIPGTNLLSRL